MRLTSLLSAAMTVVILGLLSYPRSSSSSEHSLPRPTPDSLTPAPDTFSYETVQKRMTEDADSGKPIIVHVTVALCDNENQGIVPVPKKIGNGQDPTNNLYWGAAYGVRSYMINKAGYRLLSRDTLADQGILERLVLHKQIKRSGKPVDVYVVADAWDGSRIGHAIWRFLAHAGGYLPEELAVSVPGRKDSTRTITADGAAHLSAFVGHNGLMDFRFEKTPTANPAAPPRSSIVLACASRSYFLDILNAGGSHPLLLTTNLMAPEAYTLDAAISSFAKGETPKQLHENVAAAYHKYQKCGMKGARRLFAVEE